MPEQYINFLRTINGLDYDGLTIYSVDSFLMSTEDQDPVYGFIDTNEIWHENDLHKHYLIFGDSDISWYCLNLKNHSYETQDKPSGTVMEKYTDFDAMLNSEFRSRLNLED